jgi:predicted N-acetyltransferase YhbS
MAGCAGRRIVGRPFYKPRVGFVLVQPLRVPLVTNDATVL